MTTAFEVDEFAYNITTIIPLGTKGHETESCLSDGVMLQSTSDQHTIQLHWDTHTTNKQTLSGPDLTGV